MSKVREDTSRIRLEVDGKQAINQLGKLEMEAKQIAIELKGMKKGTDEYVAASKRLKEANAEVGKMRTTMGLAGMTMSQLVRYQKDLRREISNTTTKGTAEYKKLQAELQRVNASVIAQRNEVNGTGKAFGGLYGSIVKVAGAMGIFAGGAAIFQGFRALIGISSEFGQSMSNLSALTGATGQDLQELEDAAMRIGGATTLSAQQTADAFSIIASKKPELLENTAALVATTEAAITLAEAAGIELPAAADALTNTLNQFGVGAEEAERFINVLAAGSKFGAGNIEFLNDAIKRFGPIAASMNISIEQSTAMMEIFAEKGVESEKAGTQFRNILLKMATGADEFNPKIVGMEQAIQNLSDANLSAAEKVKLFGVENFLVGEVMLASGDRFKEFTDKVTGTNIAVEQARARIDNFSGDMKGLGSITQEYAIRLGSLITDGLRPFIQGTTTMLHALKATPEFIRQNKDLFIAFGAALIAFNTAQIASTALKVKDAAVTYYKIIADKAAILSTVTLTSVTAALNAAFTANPIGMVVKAVALLIGGFTILYNRSEKVRAGIAGIASVAVEVWNIVKETFGQFIGGFKKILDGDFKNGVKDIGKSIAKSNPIILGLTEGKRLAGAFTKGYKDKLESEKDELEKAAEDIIPTIPGMPGAPDAPGGPGGSDVSEEEKKALESKLEDMRKQWEAHQGKLVEISRQYQLLQLGDEERETEINRQKYRELEEELIGFYENKVITTAEFETQLGALEIARLNEVNDIKEKFKLKDEEDKQKELEKVASAINPILEGALPEDEMKAKLIEKENIHFDTLRAINEKYGIDITDIELARRIKLDEIADTYNQKDLERETKLTEAKIQLGQQLSMALGAAIDMVGNKSGELTSFQKVLTGAQIAIDLAAGLSAIIPLATASAAKDGPLAAFTLAGYIASMGAMVFGAIGKARAALSSSKIPEYNSSTGDQKSGPTRRGSSAPKSYYMGGATGEGMGFGDKYGEYAGYVHKREYVIPEIVTADPWVANLLPAIEAVRQDKVRGFAMGGETTSGSMATGPGMMSDPEIKQLLLQIAKNTSKIPEKLRAYLVYSDLEDFQEEIDTLRDRYKA